MLLGVRTRFDPLSYQLQRRRRHGTGVQKAIHSWPADILRPSRCDVRGDEHVEAAGECRKGQEGHGRFEPETAQNQRRPVLCGKRCGDPRAGPGWAGACHDMDLGPADPIDIDQPVCSVRCGAGEHEPAGNRPYPHCVREQGEALRNPALLDVTKIAEVLPLRINDKNAAIGCLQEWRHSSLRLCD